MADYFLKDAPGIIRAREKARIESNPVGPPTPVRPPGPVMSGQPMPGYGTANVTRPGPVPIGFDGNRGADRAAMQDPSFLRPVSGRWSVHDLDPNQPTVSRPLVAGAVPGGMPAPAKPAGAPPAAAAPPATQLPTQTVNPSSGNTAPGRAGIGMQSTGIPGISEITGNPDGSRTFTDRPDGTMAALATRGTLRRPDAVPTSERDAYLANVPTLGAGAGGVPQITRPMIGGGGGINPLMAQRFAQSDAIAVANEDPRSAAGTAARNARLRRDYAGPQTRTQRDGSARAYEQTIAGLVGPGAAGMGAATELARTQMGEAGANQRAQIGADAAVQQARITRPRDQYQPVTLEDGTLAQVGENGLSRPVLDAEGRPVRPLRQTDTQLARDAMQSRAKVQEQLAKATQEQLMTMPAAKTPEEKAQQIASARFLSAQVAGLRTASGEDGSKLVEINGEWVPL